MNNIVVVVVAVVVPILWLTKSPLYFTPQSTTPLNHLTTTPHSTTQDKTTGSTRHMTQTSAVTQTVCPTTSRATQSVSPFVCVRPCLPVSALLSLLSPPNNTPPLPTSVPSASTLLPPYSHLADQSRRCWTCVVGWSCRRLNVCLVVSIAKITVASLSQVFSPVRRPSTYLLPVYVQELGGERCTILYSASLPSKLCCGGGGRS